MGTLEVARSPLPKSVEKYAGKWVAIRDGRIVASAETLDELYENPRVKDTDAVYPVPERGAYFF